MPSILLSISLDNPNNLCNVKEFTFMTGTVVIQLKVQYHRTIVTFRVLQIINRAVTPDKLSSLVLINTERTTKIIYRAEYFGRSVSFENKPDPEKFLNRKIHFSQPTVQSLVRLHVCAGWPGSMLVAKADHYRFWQDKPLNNYAR